MADSTEVSTEVVQTAVRTPRRVRRRSGRGDRLNLFSNAPEPDDSTGYGMAQKSMSKQLPDPFKRDYGHGSDGKATIIEPPFNPHALMRLPDENNMLRQCIDAMVTNIESFGARLEFVGEEGQEDSEKSQAEHIRLQNLMDDPNGEYTLIELRERVRRDLETFASAYIEVRRDKQGDVFGYWHVPSRDMRLTGRDTEETIVNRPIMRGGQMIKMPVPYRFRRYLQRVSNKRVYFKEYGDPRKIDPATGEVDDALSDDDAASEIIHICLYSPTSPYGVPRWINQLPAILGSRESELTNLQFFRDNAIPAMAVLVSGGILTDDTLQAVEEHFTHRRGRESMNRILVIEASGDEENASTDGAVPAPRVDLKPLMAERQGDAMFQSYDEKNSRKIRSSFRLPALLVGLSEDHSHATAQASLVTAESQVFGPERNKMDDIINRFIFADVTGKMPTYWRCRSNPARLVSSGDLLEALRTLNTLGAITPNIAIGVANELFDLNIELVEEDWGNLPFTIVMKHTDKLKDFEKYFKEVEEALDDAEEDEEEEPKKPPTGDSESEEDQEEDTEQLTKAQRKEAKRLALDPLRRLAEAGKKAAA